MRHRGSERGRGKDKIVKGHSSLTAGHQHKGWAMLEEAWSSRRDCLKVRRVQSKPQCLYHQFRPSEPLSSVLGMVETLMKSKSAAASQGPSLETVLVRTSISGLSLLLFRHSGKNRAADSSWLLYSREIFLPVLFPSLNWVTSLAPISSDQNSDGCFSVHHAQQMQVGEVPRHLLCK